MFRNNYDTDITTWSPAGRLYQVEYAMEAVKQGSPTVGVKSKTHVVLAALKRAPSQELSSFQEKVFKLDDFLGMSISGLISDARILSRFIRQEAMYHRYMQGTSIPVLRLAETLCQKHQRHIQSAAKRPFGVGLLVAGYDVTGTHLLQTSPSADVYDFKATAIGSRSQSARTYLERHFATFADCALPDLVMHALKALATTAAEGTKLNTQNTTIAIVGIDTPFTIYNEEAARQFLDNFRLGAEDAVQEGAEPAEEHQPPSEEPMLME